MLNFLGKVVVPPGTSRNNTNNTAAYLAGTGNYNATVAAYPASAADGAAGNLWTFAVTGDSGTGVRITVNPTAKTILVLYQTGVSTVTMVNAAIAALTGANKVLRVEIAGGGVLRAQAERHLAAHDPPRRVGNQPQDGQRGHALAAARFAHQGQSLAGRQAPAHALDGFDPFAARAEMRLEIGYF